MWKPFQTTLENHENPPLQYILQASCYPFTYVVSLKFHSGGSGQINSYPFHLTEGKPRFKMLAWLIQDHTNWKGQASPDSQASPPKASHTIFPQGVLWVPHLRRTSSVSNQALQDPKSLLHHRWAVVTHHALEHASLGHWCNISTDSGLLHDFKISFILVGIPE